VSDLLDRCVGNVDRDLPERIAEKLDMVLGASYAREPSGSKGYEIISGTGLGVYSRHHGRAEVNSRREFCPQGILKLI
jgi:hypothetical protein